MYSWYISRAMLPGGVVVVLGRRIQAMMHAMPYRLRALAVLTKPSSSSPFTSVNAVLTRLGANPCSMQVWQWQHCHPRLDGIRSGWEEEEEEKEEEEDSLLISPAPFLGASCPFSLASPLLSVPAAGPSGALELCSTSRNKIGTVRRAPRKD